MHGGREEVYVHGGREGGSVGVCMEEGEEGRERSAC